MTPFAHRPYHAFEKLVTKYYFWKSAKWVRRLLFIAEEQTGCREQYGYHIRGDQWKEERYS